MNKQLLDKILGEFEEKIDEISNLVPSMGGESKVVDFGYKVSNDNGIFTITDWSNIQRFLTQALVTVSEDNKTENSNRIMFQQGFKAGQEDMKKKILEEMPPKHKPHLGSENQDEYVAFSNGYNECRDDIIKLIERI